MDKIKHENIAKANLSDANVVSLAQPGEAINELKSGQVEGVVLEKAIAGLNSNMNTLDQGTNGMISGTESDLGKVMINMTEAQLSLETAVQVRNKVIEAYNDIKNMQF